MFLASNILYLLIRLAQKQNIPISFYSITLFLVPSIIYFFAAQFTHTSLLLNREHFLLVILAAFFWSYLGNYFSQKAILLSSNPGYSLILQKSYVVITTIAAVFLFKAEFSWQKFIAILFILFFSMIIAISTEEKKIRNFKWIYFSLLTNICLAFGSLISKHFLNLGMQPFVYLFYINIFVATLNFFDFKKQKISLKLSKKQISLAIFIGIFSMAFNFSMQLAYRIAPNIGYVSAINISSIMSVTLLSGFIFKDDLSKLKIAGILGVLISLFFLVI
jgi:drug/metabolite transporter (DMT)-like permease